MLVSVGLLYVLLSSPLPNHCAEAFNPVHHCHRSTCVHQTHVAKTKATRSISTLVPNGKNSQLCKRKSIVYLNMNQQPSASNLDSNNNGEEEDDDDMETKVNMESGLRNKERDNKRETDMSEDRGEERKDVRGGDRGRYGRYEERYGDSSDAGDDSMGRTDTIQTDDIYDGSSNPRGRMSSERSNVVSDKIYGRGYDNDYDYDFYDSRNRGRTQRDYDRRNKDADRSDYGDEYSDDGYFDEEFYDDSGDHDDHKDDEYPSQAPSWEWETYRKSTHVYLPPPIAEGEADDTPKTILHFIGGTFFGSYPLQFYKPLLERIATKSNTIVVATSIPVTLSSNPLNHYQITKHVAKSFRNTYDDVIVDEYGTSTAAAMDIVGIGHSLGSRFHAILNSSSRLRKIAFRRRGNVFIAFNNYNAISSVPGVQSLEKGIEETFERSRQQLEQQQRQRQRRRSDTFYDEYEIGLGDVISAVNEGLQDQLTSFKTAITPDLDKASLEFQPSPQQLWDGIKKEYTVRDTLVVQFDRDSIDQSSRLAKLIVESDFATAKENTDDTTVSVNNVNATVASKDEDKMTNEEQSNADESNSARARTTDVKFARLRGTHLTPVSYSDTFIMQAFKKTSPIAMDQVLKEAIEEESDYRPKSKRKQERNKNRDLDNLSDTISSYIMHIRRKTDE